MKAWGDEGLGAMKAWGDEGLGVMKAWGLSEATAQHHNINQINHPTLPPTSPFTLFPPTEITAEQLQAFVPVLLAQVHIEALLHGNLSRQVTPAG